MNLRSIRLWIAIMSTALVVFLAVGDIGRKSPGPLALVHSQDPELAGRGSCSMCHGGWLSRMPEACLECHHDIDVQITGAVGLHGVVGEDKAMRCALCHSEHHGPEFELVNTQSFAQAGATGPEDFDHEFVGFAMDGGHLQLECTECHANASKRVLWKGEKRFGGLSSNCATCHEDAHAGRFSLACAKCHGQNSFKELASAGHEEFLPLVGGHGETDCRECHGRGSLRSLEALGEGSLVGQRECLDCHQSPHREDFVDGVAQLESMTKEGSCSACHRAEHLSFRDDRLDVTPEQHAISGFPLSNPHSRVACDDCHASDARTFAYAYPGRNAQECKVCHADPHDGQFDRDPYATQGCIACHETDRFEPHAFDVESHERTTFPLTGSHVEVSCRECHKIPGEGVARVFHRTPSDCQRCHGDAHEGYFRRFNTDPDGCATCHLTSSFSELPGEGFDHARWTGLPVFGAHAQEPCESCHKRSDEPDRFGRTFGRVEEHFGHMKDGGRGCVPCHSDPHEGAFDSLRHPRVVNGQIGCARCHSQSSFRAFSEPFAHHRWTGFALEGVHAAISCSECHEPLLKPDELGRTWSRAEGSECSSCHVDNHAGQFVRNGTTDCRRCHRSSESFSELSFRHNLDSRFNLGEAHEDLACSACHHPVQIGDVEVVRYKPLGMKCVDCHGSQGDRFRRRRGRK